MAEILYGIHEQGIRKVENRQDQRGAEGNGERDRL
jgi:hypothetical protein